MVRDADSAGEHERDGPHGPDRAAGRDMAPPFRKAGLALAAAWMFTGVLYPLIFPERVILMGLWSVPLVICTLAWGWRALDFIAGPEEQPPP